MTPRDSLTARAEAPGTRRRRTVRIVRRRTPSRAAILSLLTAVSAAGVAFAAWRWWRPAPPVPFYERTIRDVELTWKCEAGHAFMAAGQVADRLCAMCDRPAHVFTLYECRQHGVAEVTVRFTEGPDGRPKVSHFRVKKEWIEASDPVPCPQCNVPMTRKQADPLEAFNREKKKTDR